VLCCPVETEASGLFPVQGVLPNIKLIHIFRINSELNRSPGLIRKKMTMINRNSLCHSSERHGRVLGIPVSYSGGPGFKFRPRYRLFLLFFFVVSAVHPGKCRDSALKFGHDSFLPNPFQFIITYHPFIRSHIVLSYIKSVLNKLQINVSLHLLSGLFNDAFNRS
jgi:hypothetical protein